MKPGDVSISDFINSLLKAARARGVSVVMIYGFQEHGRNKMVMSSNTGPAGTDAVLTWVRGLDPEAAAKALHENGIEGATGVCAVCTSNPDWRELPGQWDALPSVMKERHLHLAQLMLNAAAANAPRVKDPSELKPS